METISADDLSAHLRRLLALATHNLRVTRTLKRRSFVEGQINALHAIGISYGLDTGE